NHPLNLAHARGTGLSSDFILTSRKHEKDGYPNPLLKNASKHMLYLVFCYHPYLSGRGSHLSIIDRRMRNYLNISPMIGVVKPYPLLDRAIFNVRKRALIYDLLPIFAVFANQKAILVDRAAIGELRMLNWRIKEAMYLKIPAQIHCYLVRKRLVIISCMPEGARI